MTSPVWTAPAVVLWTELLLNSYRHWTGQDLISRDGTPEEQAQRLFHAPFVVVSHGTEADPVINYGNRAALELWETTWERLTKTPSRFTTEPMNRDERERMLARAAAQGIVHEYRGVRITTTGRRFLVERASVWNIVDAKLARHGQAATFATWTFLEDVNRRHKP